MKRWYLLLAFFIPNLNASAQGNKQLRIAAVYRDLNMTEEKNTYSFSYNYSPQEFQITYRNQINSSSFHMLGGVAFNSYHSLSSSYPHRTLYYMEDHRLYSFSEYKAVLLRPMLEVQTQMNLDKWTISAGIRGSFSFGLNEQKKFDSRYEIYSYDSLGVMNAQPDTVIYSYEDWHTSNFYQYPKFLVEINAEMTYRLNDFMEVYACAAVGIGTGSRYNPVTPAKCAGIGLSFNLNPASQGTGKN